MNRRRQPTPGRLASCLAGLALLAFATVAPASPPLRIAASSLAPDEAAATDELVEAAFARLPTIWREALDPRIEVGWRDDLPAQVHGRAQGRKLWLDRALLRGWMEASGPASEPEAPGRHAALATLIHELAHFYDRSPRGGLSREPRLLDLAGWQVAPMHPRRRRARNAFSDRSPDRYELSDPVEFVAVNLEYFLLDPGYACRRPALHRYFAAHFGDAPPSRSCAPGFVFVHAPDEAGASPLLRIDAERVYEVDYLLAEPNARIMSRWGHSMLRLVICAPGRPRGPGCRLDLRHHRVLSFRAFVDDVQISSWRGLTGSYPSRLFVLPLEQVIEEYTKVELRGLRSVPLRLDRDEIAALLERAARLHWSYDGRYYFLSNNCATETFKLLHDGVPRLAGERLASPTPTGLLRRLQRAGVADAGVLDDPVEAVRLGYRFEALDAHYQAMFDVARHALELPQRTAEEWMDAPADARAAWLESADLRAAAALLLLERAALRREQSRAREDLKRLFLGDAPGVGAATRGALAEALQLEGVFSRPAALLPGDGYGLPQAGERAALARAGADHAARWQRQREALHDAARYWLPAPRQAALDGIEANIDALGRRLRHLHAEGDGRRPRSPPDAS